jgi:hypothetical protein
VLILGTMPEVAGIGGVSIHVQRLLKWLDKSGYKCDFCDYKISNRNQQLQAIFTHKVVHVHVSNPCLRFFYIICCILFRSKSVLTIHGNVGRFTKIKNFFDRISIKLCNVPILINNNSYNIAKQWNRRAVLLPAFLPPIEDESLPDTITQVIEKARREGRQIVVTNASAVSYTVNGEEIYGIEFLIKYFGANPDYELLISDPTGRYRAKYLNANLTNIVFLTEPHSFFELMKSSDIMIRNTATDGDSLSVREGLYIGIKVLATDRVDRPDGVSLFRYNDIESISKALYEPSENRSLVHYYNIIPEVEKIYNSLL